jgi:uncharacterized protein (DUF302 family)
METKKMIVESVSRWGFDKTVELIKGAAEKRNWNIPIIHDLQQSLAMAGKIVNSVKVIEVCKPEFSGKMLEKNNERFVSVMMPCRISVYIKDDGKTYLALINGAALADGLPESVRHLMVAASNEVNEIVDAVVS